MLAITARQASEAEEFGNKLVGLASEHAFASLSACGLIARAWALGQRGENGAAAVDGVRKGSAVRYEACDILAPVYDWFTEGFDTSDLKAAKALLDALA